MDLQSMIDVTSFGKVCRLLDHNSGISQIIQVMDDRLTLLDVAEAFVQGDNFQVKTWVKSGAIKAGTYLYHSTTVECIRLIPFCLFKSLNKTYE